VIAIEKGIPAPVGKNHKYPWDNMEVGDSFFVEGATTTQMAGNITAQRRRLGWSFSQRKQNGGVRVWRVA
jgi:hypothetical protein